MSTEGSPFEDDAAIAKQLEIFSQEFANQHSSEELRTNPVSMTEDSSILPDDFNRELAGLGIGLLGGTAIGLTLNFEIAQEALNALSAGHIRSFLEYTGAVALVQGVSMFAGLLTGRVIGRDLEKERRFRLNLDS